MPPPIPNLPAEHVNVRFHAEGGMSRVYVADHVALQRREAIKLLYPQATAEERQLFMREGRILAKLNHDFICQVFDVKNSADGPYLRMEFIEGPTLRERMDERKLSISEAIDITLKLASALSLAHSKGVVHSDLKPENVLVESATNRPKLIDFGIARRIEGHGLASTGMSGQKVRGTPQYISPEQLRGEPASPGSDLYSLGVMLFEMLVGEPPFRGDRDALVEAHLYRVPPRLPGNLSDLQPLMDRLLAKQVDERFADCETFDAALVAVLEDSETLRIHLPPDRIAAANRAGRLAQSRQNKKGGRSTQYFTTSMAAPTRPQESVASASRPADTSAAPAARQLLAKLSAGTATAAQRFQFIASLLTDIERAESVAALGSIASLMDESERVLGERIDLSVARAALEQHEADLRSRLRKEQSHEALARSQQAASRGQWLAPEEGSAVAQAKLAATLDPDNQFARDWLARLPAAIAQAISHLNRDNHFDQALDLATGALASFPGETQLDAQLKLVSAAIAREASRREHDAAMFTLAARLPQDPAGNAQQAAQRLVATDPADATRPGARSLVRELRNWLERLADGGEADRLLDVRTSMDAQWQQLRDIALLRPSISRIEAVLAELEQRRRREQRGKELAAALHAALAHGMVFDVSDGGLLSVVATAFSEGYRAETERFLAKRTAEFAAAMAGAVGRGEPSAAELDAWMFRATGVLGEHAIVTSMRRAREDARWRQEVCGNLALLRSRIESGGRTGGSDFSAMFQRIASNATEDSPEIRAGLESVIAAVAAAVSATASDQADELDTLLNLLADCAASCGLAANVAEARALVALARRRRQQSVRRAALELAIEGFLAAPDIQALERVASAARGMDERPASLDVVTDWLAGHARRLGAAAEWASCIDWLSRARSLYSPQLHAQVDRDMEHARLALERARQTAALRAALAPDRILARTDNGLLASLRTAQRSGIGDSIASILLDGYADIEGTLLAAAGSLADVDVDRWLDDLEQFEPATNIASLLRESVDAARRLRPPPVEVPPPDEIPSSTESFNPPPVSPFDAFCSAPSRTTAIALCLAASGLGSTERAQAGELVVWFLEQLLRSEAFDEFDSLLGVAGDLLAPATIQSLGQARDATLEQLSVTSGPAVVAAPQEDIADLPEPPISHFRTEAYAFEPPSPPAPEPFTATEAFKPFEEAAETEAFKPFEEAAETTSRRGEAVDADAFNEEVDAEAGSAPSVERTGSAHLSRDRRKPPDRPVSPGTLRSPPVGDDGPRPRQAQKRWLPVVAILLVAVVAAAYLLVPEREPPEKSPAVVESPQPVPTPPQPIPSQSETVTPPIPARQVGEVFSDSLAIGGRGELMEAFDFLSFLRMAVLSPLLQVKNEKQPRGLRRVETELSLPDLENLKITIAEYNRKSILKALENAVSIYRSARRKIFPPTVILQSKAEYKVMEYLKSLKR